MSLARVEDALQRRAVLYDKQGDRHYDYASAWIKATRGSDPDASLYYLAVMLEGGEDPRFIARRMVILASEDIGNADPAALSVATAAAAAVEHVGLPEARYALAQAAIYLSLAPKSDAAGRALGAAQAHVREHGAQPAPAWLRSGPRGPAQDRGEYENPHRLPGHVGPQELAPEGVAGERFYRPGRGRGRAGGETRADSPERGRSRSDNRCSMASTGEQTRPRQSARTPRPARSSGSVERHAAAARGRRRRRRGEGPAAVGAAARRRPRALHAPHGPGGDRRLRRARRRARRRAGPPPRRGGGARAARGDRRARSGSRTKARARWGRAAFASAARSRSPSARGSRTSPTGWWR